MSNREVIEWLRKKAEGDHQKSAGAGHDHNET